MNRLDNMAVLLDVVQTGSLSAAGRKLGMPLATVSRKLQELEAHLKARLLIRSTRRLALTDAGRAYVAACKRILQDVGEAERAVSGEYSAPRGELIVTAPMVFGRMHVLPVATQFLKAYPEVDLRLVLGDRVVNLIEDHVDLAVRIGELPDSSLIATRIGMIRPVICASPKYLTRHGTPKFPQDLAGHPCVTFDALMPAQAWSFRIDDREMSVPIRSRLTVNSAEAAIDAAIAGVGVTRVLSYQAEEARQAGALKFVLGKFEPEPFPASLVYAASGRLPLKLRAFLDFAAPRLRARLQVAK